MTRTELLPLLQKLPRVEKLQLIQFLITELIQEEDSTLLEPGKSYPVWSPYDAYEAANVLLQALEQSGTQS